MSSNGEEVIGSVGTFDGHRGLGTINANGEEFPFHCVEIADGSRDIALGALVSFVVAYRFGLVEASNVVKL
jgi:CspA family cold shock protein